MGDVVGPGDRPTVGVVIVTYNSAEHIGACLASVLPQLPDDGSKVVVVDNASSDDTAAVVERDWGGVDFVRSSANLGFAKGCNLGAKRTDARYVLLVNPDSQMEPGCVDAMLELAERSPRSGIYGGRTYTPDGTFDPRSCLGRPTIWSLTCFATGLSSLLPDSAFFNPEGIGGWARDDERPVGVVTGCLLLIRRALWDELGGLDEQFFMYGEDADLSIRAARLGYAPVISPGARLVHHVGASSSQDTKMVMLHRGKVTLVQKIWTGPARTVAMSLLIGGIAIRARTAGLLRALLPAPAAENRRAGPASWTALWNRRDEWRRGW